MKTPKRYFSYPSDPNADMSDLYEQEPKQHARWKRRNREAQYKRTIARLRRIERRKLRQDKLLNLYRARVAQLKWDMNGMEFELATAEDNYNELRKQNSELSNGYIHLAARHETMKQFMGGAEQNLQGLWWESVFGQNIEGS